MPDVVIEGYREVVSVLNRLEPEVSKQFKKEVRAIADEVAAYARGNALDIGTGQTVVHQISASVTTRGAAVRVRGTPGTLYERGAKGRGYQSTWRHPLFGNRAVWVDQDTKPFVRPAIDMLRPKILAQIEAAARRAAGALRG